MKINFITNIKPSEISGGISGMNAAAYAALSEIADVRYVGPINPPAGGMAAYLSKIQRRLGLTGDFYFYSKSRLLEIATQVARQCDASADFDFYMGFTPWILCSSARPYVAWNDCSFVDYLKIYHNPKRFSKTQQAWLHQSESSWMSRANKVFFSSRWAMDRARIDYDLSANRVDSFGIFGAMAPPDADAWNGSRDFYFISTDFKRKNGHLCRAAMDEVWKIYPDARLRIIGSPPSATDLVAGKVIYEGYFNKRNVEENAAFRAHLSKAFALLHPTDSDITPLTVIEAGYFGCPAISVDDFALREITSPSNHHLLLHRPLNAAHLSASMVKMLADTLAYKQARQNAREFAVSNLRPEAFTERLQSGVKAALCMI